MLTPEPMLTPEQIARRVRQDWYRPALSSVVRTDFLCVLAELGAALEENAALKERLREMHLLLALAWGAIRAGRDLVDLNGPDSRLAAWCEGVDSTVPEWETEARALLDPQAPAEGRQKEE
jgi:hypothetical protein